VYVGHNEMFVLKSLVDPPSVDESFDDIRLSAHESLQLRFGANDDGPLLGPSSRSSVPPINLAKHSRTPYEIQLKFGEVSSISFVSLAVSPNRKENVTFPRP
jgi:hypothetical protein